MGEDQDTKKRKAVKAETAKLCLSLVDLTSLNDDDTDEKIIQLCKDAAKAKEEIGTCTAAVCIYPKFVALAKKTLKELGIEDVKVATVTNFPHGSATIAVAVKETEEAVKAGADEVDVVFPYKAFINGDDKIGFDLVQQCKAACKESERNCRLKVIIESGELKEQELIKKASDICIKAGADFIKTSTGKVPVNATIEAAETMLKAIKDAVDKDENLTAVGFKAAGGIRDFEAAEKYVEVAKKIFGEKWVTSEHFRFGASSLLKNLITYIKEGSSGPIDESVY
mmetsp:Transcript_4378/g.5096  ORF Transcript_4378/g.5096 Transcript_4378/m.5096 type:complete len:282 (-) Transcript_4378:78-923(-)